MICCRCGNEMDGDPVMVIYGDEAFADKPQKPFAIDQDCFDQYEHITGAEWQNDANGQPVLVEFPITRYLKQ